MKTGYPYLDTFHFLDWSTGKLWNTYKSSDKTLSLKSTSGSYQVGYSNSIVFCEPLEDFIPKESAYWDNSKKSWMPLSKLQRFKRKIKDWIDF